MVTLERISQLTYDGVRYRKSRTVDDVSGTRRIKLKASEARIEQCGYIGERSIPVLSPLEHRSLEWSTEPHILRTSKGIKIYSNYTVYLDEQGFQQSRYTLVKHYTKPDHLLVPRGFTVNFDIDVKDVRRIAENGDKNRNKNDPTRFITFYSWRFKTTSSFKPAVIDLCFYDEQTKDSLKDVTVEAMNVWHQALGPQKGVQFEVVCGDVCYTGPHVVDRAAAAPKTRSKFTRADTIQVIDRPNQGASSIPGYMAANNWGRHTLLFDRTAFDTTSQMGRFGQTAEMVHGLGHIMGLHHEHQRYDAKNYITLHCDKVPGYAEALEAYKRETKGDEAKFSKEQVEGFDFESIMLYPQSDKWSKNDGGTWVWALAPSAGDIHAVKKIYPDVLKAP
ncbi:hypothetical protein EJ08DRAFT_678142 [Tothia fuscella]|uniref:Peptidase M12A domain-containing protein n=1 Tax=Tothia fuscella TaxID=1048955 RepID=A0A9P4NT22_9PEZI|nr:hypothetical protein EJ08DRAFT_678142 [Tothia fuscella]